MARIAILGTGAWGTALANILLENGHHIIMWGIDECEIKDLNNQKNTRYYQNKKLVTKPTATSDINNIINFNPSFIFIAVPSVHITNVLKKVVNKLENKCYFVNVSKGLDPKSNNVWSKTIKKLIKGKSKGFVTLIGPSFAIEVFNDEPTVVNTISTSTATARMVNLLFNNNHFKCVEWKDEIGGQIISALKNVMAIAMGITYELHTSINTRAALIAQATKEIAQIIKIYGGKVQTITQFCGIGDIYLTCTDEKSRNFSFGKSIAISGLKSSLKNNKKTVEGYWTTKIIYKIIQRYRINAPILTEVYQVLFKNKNPKNFVKNIIHEIID